MRHSMACPRNWMSRCLNGSFCPEATRICACTISMPVIISVTGMLHLHARVHLDEVELVLLEQELEGARAAVADLAAGFGAALADARLEPRIDERGGRLLDDLLVAALHGAVAIAQIDGVACARRPAPGSRRGADSPGTSPGRPWDCRMRPALRCGSCVTALSSAASVCTTRMPRPPPPPAALMITG